MCAAGTGAFIDQMAALLRTDSEGLNELAKDYNKFAVIYYYYVCLIFFFFFIST
jgi:activator of 2-hydroxyglutaryl-CoA dehydratase